MNPLLELMAVPWVVVEMGGALVSPQGVKTKQMAETLTVFLPVIAGGGGIKRVTHGRQNMMLLWCCWCKDKQVIGAALKRSCVVMHPFARVFVCVRACVCVSCW